jgi:hypothetical protein
MQRYPDIAQTVMPGAFWGVRHLEHILFFYGQRSADILRGDVALLRLRRQLHVLTCFVLTIPILSLFLIALTMRLLK